MYSPRRYQSLRSRTQRCCGCAMALHGASFSLTAIVETHWQVMPAAIKSCGPHISSMGRNAKNCSKNVMCAATGQTSCLVGRAYMCLLRISKHWLIRLRSLRLHLLGTRRLQCSHKRVPCRVSSTQERLLLAQHCKGKRSGVTLKNPGADGLLKLVTELHFISNHPRLLGRHVRSSWCMQALQLRFPMLVQR